MTEAHLEPPATTQVPVRRLAPGASLPIEARSSVERGQGPPPGVYSPPFRWEDLTDGPPPRRKTRGEGAYVIYNGMEVGVEFRLTYATIVSVDPGEDSDSPLDDVIHVDSRLGVQKRTLLELMDRERAFTDRVTSRLRERLGRRLVRQRAFANRLPAGPVRNLAVRGIRLQARVMMGAIHRFRSFMRALVEIPDHIVSRSLRAQAHLGGRHGRRYMWAGLKDPSTLTNEQKSVVLFLSTVTLVTLVLVLNTFFALVLPQHAALYRRVFADASVSLLGVMAFPVPIEPLLVDSTLRIGAGLALTGFVAGKMIGVWLLYFLGDALYEAVKRKTDGKPRTKRAVDWMQRSANRFGFFLLVVINAFPLVPDFLLYVFAISGMRFRPYFWGILVGTAIKFGGIALGVVLIGPEEVRAFLADPFAPR